MLKSIITAALLLGSTSWAMAHPHDNASSHTVIKTGTLIDTENGTTLKDHYIVIEDGIIQAVVDPYKFQRMGGAKGADIIDLSDYTVMPGLSDSHVHLTSGVTDHGYNALAVSSHRAAINGVANAKDTLMAGFTTVRNLGAGQFADVDLMKAIDDGTVPGPRIIPAGHAIGITGGHCDSNLLPYEYKKKSDGVADGPWGVRVKVRENNKYGAKVIKFCGTGGVLSKGTKIGAQQFSFEEMEAIVDEAKLLGLKVAVHAHGADGVFTAMRAGVDSVEHASFVSDYAINYAKEKGIFLSMDIYVSDYILSEGEAAGILEESLEKERRVGKKQRERFQAAAKAGVKMAYGTDAGVYPHGQNGKQFAYMTKWGLTPMQAIQAATIRNAELFGLEDTIGSLAKGKAADIIAVNGNPLDNIQELEDVDFVMKGGVVYKGTE